MKEIWDLYTKNRVKTNKTMLRGDIVPSGYYHLVIHVCIFNSKGEMLIQQRQPFKDGWPNLWDLSVGGSAIHQEDSQTAAEREVLEELGLSLSLKELSPNLTIYFENGFDDIYLIENDLPISDLTLQYEEVQDVQWATKEEILNRIDTGEFISYHKSIIKTLFDLKKTGSMYCQKESLGEKRN